MAKRKHREALTMEERLEAALVPEDEHPYEVPENWCWVYLGNVVQTSKEKTDIFDDASIKYVGLEHIEKDGGIIGYDSAVGIKSLKNIFHEGQLLYGKLRPYLNKHDVADFEGVCSTDILVFNTAEHVSASFIDYYFNQSDFIEYAISNSKGINLPRVSERIILEASFPLPPEKEQIRIVERIEGLLSQLDEARDKAQEALDGFEERRIAILHKAFNGELTAKWRSEHNTDISSWDKISLKDCGEWFGGGTPATSVKEYWDGGNIPWITSKDMKEKRIDDSQLHITMEGVNNSSAQYCERPAVLFVMRSGILRRIFPVCMVNVPFTVNQDLKAVITNDSIEQEYLYWACTGYEKDIRENCMKDGTTVESVEARKLMAYQIPLAPIEEQKEIVRIIDKLLEGEEQAKSATEDLITDIDLLKKSILAKAFRGELGTNDPEDKCAIELLKVILGGTEEAK